MPWHPPTPPSVTAIFLKKSISLYIILVLGYFSIWYDLASGLSTPEKVTTGYFNFWGFSF
jgi:hypothetical protein